MEIVLPKRGSLLMKIITKQQRTSMEEKGHSLQSVITTWNACFEKVLQ